MQEIEQGKLWRYKVYYSKILKEHQRMGKEPVPDPAHPLEKYNFAK